MNEVNKKLLSDVLNIEVIEIGLVKGNYLEYKCPWNKSFVEINIYELANKCKNWAYREKNGYKRISSIIHKNKWTASIYYGKKQLITFIGFDTEAEAIFEACEWILKRVNND